MQQQQQQQLCRMSLLGGRGHPFQAAQQLAAAAGLCDWGSVAALFVAVLGLQEVRVGVGQRMSNESAFRQPDQVSPFFGGGRGRGGG